LPAVNQEALKVTIANYRWNCNGIFTLILWVINLDSLR
jgi:transcriptional regulator with XRE-family HTH domain